MTLDEILSHAPCYLDEDQRRFFIEKGYQIFPELIDEKQLVTLRSVLKKVVDASRTINTSGNRFDLEKGHTAQNPRLRRATYLDDFDVAFWELCSTSVIPDIAADLLGPNVRFRELMVNFKWSGGGAEVKWHQDISFYPHTHTGVVQFLVFLEDVGQEQGPLQVLAGSHTGPIYELYNEDGVWTGAMRDSDLAKLNMDQAVTVTGKAGTVSVHHSRTLHGSSRNISQSSRPAFVITYSAADAIPYTAVPYPSSHYGKLVRGHEPSHAHHEAVNLRLPPTWEGEYTSIFEHQAQQV